MNDRLKDYFYDYPEKQVALYPSRERDASRLLVLNKKTKKVQHQSFKDISDHFQEGDVLVLNDSKVFPCRLITQRKTGGRQEIFLVREDKKDIWHVLVNASQKIRAGDIFFFDQMKLVILDDGGAERKARLEYEGDLQALLHKIAKVPLPPYIHRDVEPMDQTRYQTIYASQTGSVAAPTAGFHFTEDTFQRLKAKGVIVTRVTLHVGPGTFLPVRCDKICDHMMHEEFFHLSKETCEVIHQAKQDGRPVTAVGTTSTRVLESVVQQYGKLKPGHGHTNIFIYPPFSFQMVDRLITNFHQPESTLLILVSAFAGRELILSSYQQAIQEKYRLFSYGDAMMIV